MRLYLTHSSNFDFQNELYVPFRQSLSQRHSIFFPHDNKNINTQSKNVIAESDYVLAEVSLPSTGQGIELGWAEAVGTPIICFYRTGSSISNSLKFVTEIFIEYSSPEDMAEKLLEWLAINPRNNNRSQGEAQ